MATGFEQVAWTICAAFRQEDFVPCFSDLDLLLDFIDSNWIGPVLYERILVSQDPQAWPSVIRDRLASETRLWTLKSSLRRAEIVRVLEAMGNASVDALLLKGLPLGYSIYSSPGLRPSCDVDLFIRDSDREGVDVLLRSLGYQCLPFEVSARTPDTGQRTYDLQSDNGYWHRIDLHWQVSGYYLYANLFSFEELWQRSISVAQLGNTARTLNLVDALILSCSHRSISERQRLIWLYDIDRIVRVLDRAQWESFIALAGRKRVKAVCLQNLRDSHVWFGTPLDGVRGLSRTLFELPEFSTLTLGRRRVDKLLLDLLSIDGWQARGLFLTELLIPSEMAARRPPDFKMWTALIMAGVRRLFEKCPAYFRVESRSELSVSKVRGSLVHE